MCHRKLTLGEKKKRELWFNQNNSFLINNRVSWNLLTTPNHGSCCSSSGPPSAEIYICAARFAEAVSSSPETRQPFNLE